MRTATEENMLKNAEQQPWTMEVEQRIKDSLRLTFFCSVTWIVHSRFEGFILMRG